MSRDKFNMDQTADILNHWAEMGRLEISKGRAFLVTDSNNKSLARIAPPALQTIPPTCELAEDYLASLASTPGSHMVLLVQAGATAVGLWHGDTLVRHKVIKKYVTRGKGKAQTTFLKTRGKSRYGSRLRLQNARIHLEETNQKMTDWFEEYGVPEQVFYSCPVRLWAEVFNAEPAPPFEKDSAIKIGVDVRVPNHEELLRVRNSLKWGELVVG